MKLKFEANQEYQLEAMQAIVDVFEGQPLKSGDFEVEIVPSSDQLQIGSELLVGNRLVLEESTILKNTQAFPEMKRKDISNLLQELKRSKVIKKAGGKTRYGVWKLDNE